MRRFYGGAVIPDDLPSERNSKEGGREKADFQKSHHVYRLDAELIQKRIACWIRM